MAAEAYRDPAPTGDSDENDSVSTMTLPEIDQGSEEEHLREGITWFPNPDITAKLKLDNLVDGRMDETIPETCLGSGNDEFSKGLTDYPKTDVTPVSKSDNTVIEEMNKITSKLFHQETAVAPETIVGKCTPGPVTYHQNRNETDCRTYPSPFEANIKSSLKGREAMDNQKAHSSANCAKRPSPPNTINNTSQDTVLKNADLKIQVSGQGEIFNGKNTNATSKERPNPTKSIYRRDDTHIHPHEPIAGPSSATPRHHLAPSNTTRIPQTNQSAMDKKRRRAVHFQGILIAVYMITWTPLCIMVSAGRLAGIKFHPIFRYSLVLLMHCNSAINPILYAIANKTVREDIRRLWTIILNRLRSRYL